MSRPRARLLVSGDFHLGRYPTRVPAGDRTLDVEAVVRSLAEEALARSVDAVVLTGDLADESNKYFEAFGVLDRTLRRLAEAGVTVFVVAGNHDHDVAASVVDQIGSDRVRVLGRGGTWEAAAVERDGREVVRVVGWSFPGPYVHESPVAAAPLDADVPVVAVLHADLDAAGSPYAPVALADLWASNASAWLLGHIHAPRLLERDGRIVLYPGSPQPLDPGEPGVHGAWIVEIGDDGRATAEAVPLATVHYATVAVDLEGVEDAVTARERVLDALRAHVDEVHAAAPSVRRAVVRLGLEGRTAAYGSLGGLADELRDEAGLRFDGVDVTVDRVEADVRPALDLAALATGSGPVATLAGIARRLDAHTPSADDARLIDEAVEALRQVRRARAFAPLERDGRFEDDIEVEAVRRLRRQVYRLLDEALRQQAGEG